MMSANAREEKELLEWLAHGSGPMVGARSLGGKQIQKIEKTAPSCPEDGETWERLAADSGEYNPNGSGFERLDALNVILRRDIARGKYNPFTISEIAAAVGSFYDFNDDFYKSISPRKKDGTIIDVSKRFERVSECGKGFSPIVSHKALYTPSGELAKVKTEGRRLCNLPHICAVDSAAHAEDDATKNAKIFAYAAQNNLVVYLMTLTASHNRNTKQAWFKAGLSGALRDLKMDSRFKEYCAEYGIELLEVGKNKPAFFSIRRLEETFGLNGAHYHYHIAAICPPGDEARKALEAVFRLLWETYAKKYGLVNAHDPEALANFRKVGFDFNGSAKGKDGKSSNQSIIDYVSKAPSWKTKAKEWGKVGEISRSAYKKAKAGHYSPFELLIKICLVDRPYYLAAKTEKAKKAALAVLMDDINTWIEYVCTTYNCRLTERGDGWKSWVEEIDKQAPQGEIEEEILCGVYYSDWEWLRRVGLVPDYNAAVREAAEGNAEPLAVFQDWLISRGSTIPTNEEIVSLRAAEENKREEDRQRRHEIKRIKGEIRAAIAAGTLEQYAKETRFGDVWIEAVAPEYARAYIKARDYVPPKCVQLSLEDFLENENPAAGG